MRILFVTFFCFAQPQVAEPEHGDASNVSIFLSFFLSCYLYRFLSLWLTIFTYASPSYPQQPQPPSLLVPLSITPPPSLLPTFPLFRCYFRHHVVERSSSRAFFPRPRVEAEHIQVNEAIQLPSFLSPRPEAEPSLEDERIRFSCN